MSEKSQQIFDFIQEYIALYGMAPTYREIGDACHLASTSQVRYYLDQLERIGRIRRRPGVARGVRVLAEEGSHQ